jgi:hypothetical protein
MKRLFVLLFLLIAATAWADSTVVVRQPSCKKACTDGTFLSCQNFEGTGFDNSESWITQVSDGIADPDYVTTHLRGSQSLRMGDDTSVGTYAMYKFSDDTGVGAVYGFFRLRMVDLPSSTYEVMQLWNVQGPLTEPSAYEAHDMIWISSTGVLQIHCNNGETFNGTAQLAINTTYYVWYYISRTSHTNGAGWVKVSTSPQIPEANEITYSGGEQGSCSYTSANSIMFSTFHGGDYEYIVDQSLVSVSAIGTICAD